MNRTARLALSVTAVSLLLAACSASPGGSPTPTGSPNATPSPSNSTAPSPNANVAIVKIFQTGGMPPPWETLRWYPSVALYADGRLILEGAQVEMYPGPALPSLFVTRLSQTGIDQVLQWAVDAGLTGPDRQLGEPILDSAVTVFTVAGPTGTHATTVTNLAGSGADIGALNQFRDLMTNVRQWLPAEDVLGEDVQYVAERLRVISFPAQPIDPAMATTLDWPLDEPLSSLGLSYGEPDEYRCAEVAGDHLATLMPLLQQSNELTLWRSDEELYQLYLHPLLPDEEACPGF